MSIGKQKGFNLVELMITIVILGVLAAIAFPTYSKYVARGKRIEATTVLMEMSGKLERNYNISYDYTKRKGETNPVYTQGAGPSVFSIDPPENYEVTIAEISTNSFVLKAVPTGAQKTRDTECQAFLLDNNGTKRAFATDPTGSLKEAMANTAANQSQCW